MITISLTFFEEYKHLKKFCNEIYGQTNGVTRYINDMEAHGLKYGSRMLAVE